jgi:hypothetical protein
MNYVLSIHDRVIVLEDDLITAPQFLNYCNKGLDLYKDAPNVYAINAYQFPIDFGEKTSFLCPLATSSWGWATWKHAWDCFDNDILEKKIIQTHEHLNRRFNFADYDYATMLDISNSWAIKWYYSVFLRNGLGLFITHSLVQNSGFDGSGTHSASIEMVQELENNTIELSYTDVIHLRHYSKLLDYFVKVKKTIKKRAIHLQLFDALKSLKKRINS